MLITGGVSRLHATAMSPNIPVVGIYIFAFLLMQVGYCVLLVLVRKQETKNAIIKAVGFPLVLSNFVMAIWAIAWVCLTGGPISRVTLTIHLFQVMQWFMISTVLQGVLLLLLLYCNMALLIYHPPAYSRPFDVVLLHAPVRFFFVLVFSLLFPLCLLYVTPSYL